MLVKVATGSKSTVVSFSIVILGKLLNKQLIDWQTASLFRRLFQENIKFIYRTPNHITLWHKNSIMAIYYSTGIEIVSCILACDLVLSLSANDISFDQKSANQVVFYFMDRPENKYSPFPLGYFNGRFEGLIVALSKHDFEIWSLFLKSYQSRPKLNLHHCCAGISKLGAIPT